MNLQIDTNPQKINLSKKITYFTPQYLQIQSLQNLQLFSNDSFFIPINSSDSKHCSIEKSPFGSYLCHKNETLSSFAKFEKEVILALNDNSKTELFIKHPSPFYSDYVDRDWLTKVGYELVYNDCNQHIHLTFEWEEQLHKMQLRKLKALTENGFEFKSISHSNIEVVHNFLRVCRQSQGLELNISFEKLKLLLGALPDRYDFFGVYREDKISAVCVSVRVTEKVAYYYLAGTSPLFRSQSPMVLLISGMVNFYRKEGYEIFDLGVSSFQGRPQETLRSFKSRMGAVETQKPSFAKVLI